MIFKNPEQLVEFFNNLDLENSTLVFKAVDTPLAEDDHAECCDSDAGVCQCDSEKSTSEFMEDDDKQNLQAFVANFVGESTVVVESFSDSPSINLQLSEGNENVFYVTDFESIADACGTGKIELPDRTSFMNMCEMNGKATVQLNMVIEGTKLSNIQVTLAKTTETPYILLSKDHFKA